MLRLFVTPIRQANKNNIAGFYRFGFRRPNSRIHYNVTILALCINCENIVENICSGLKDDVVFCRSGLKISINRKTNMIYFVDNLYGRTDVLEIKGDINEFLEYLYIDCMMVLRKYTGVLYSIGEKSLV